MCFCFRRLESLACGGDTRVDISTYFIALFVNSKFPFCFAYVLFISVANLNHYYCGGLSYVLATIIVSIPSGLNDPVHRSRMLLSILSFTSFIARSVCDDSDPPFDYIKQIVMR